SRDRSENSISRDPDREDCCGEPHSGRPLTRGKGVIMESVSTPCEPEVTVGLDDSPSARAALAWAARYARSAGLRLRAVHVLGQVPDPMAWVSSYDAAGYLGDAPSVEELEGRIKEVVRESFESVRPEPDWRLDFVGGSPGKTLIKES